MEVNYASIYAAVKAQKS